ncbi:MAG: hypothetical protein LBC59_09550 [Chitinispirillales bacterium]|jgi:hypothetical protein|nr:hypothetical protein [Chitinispirillales bacterium]
MTETQREAIRAARNEYSRRYRRENPDKIRAATERYWLRKAARMQAEKEGESQ